MYMFYLKIRKTQSHTNGVILINLVINDLPIYKTPDFSNFEYKNTLCFKI